MLYIRLSNENWAQAREERLFRWKPLRIVVIGFIDICFYRERPSDRKEHEACIRLLNEMGIKNIDFGRR